MGTSIRLKKSSVSSNAPGTSDIDYGELAINYADGKLYYKTSSNAIDFFGASSIGGGGYWTQNGSDVYYDSGNVGIGVTSPGEALEVDGNVEITGEFIGDLRGPVTFKAQASENLTLGDVVYISGVSGQTPTVGKADADDAAKMPAFGLVSATTTSGNPCTVVTFGTFEGYDTVNTNDSPTWSLGDTLYVDTTAGGLTNVAPTGESALIQNIGKVQRVDSSSGRIKVGGAGRTNATPNLNEGRLFVGNASNQSVADDTVHIDIANTRVGINDTTPSYTLDVNGTFRTTGNTTLGDGVGDTLTINAGTVDIPNISAGTDNTVLVYNGSSIVTDEIDSRVWGSTLVDGSGTANTITKWSDSNTVTDSVITDDGSTVTIGGNLTVNGTTTTLNATNSVVTDNLFELNSGVTSNANDSGIIIERGSTGNNALFIWDESADKFAVGTTTATADSTGNITYTDAGLRVSTLETSGNVTLGDASGDSVTINAATIALANVAAGTDNTVLVYNGSSIVTDEIDSRVWGSTLVDGSGTANKIAKWSDSNTITDSLITDDGTKVTIDSASNGDIELVPNGTGVVVFKGDATKGSGQFKLNCEQNSHGITIKGPPHSAAASYTLVFPNNDGDASQVLTTDGSGNLSWTTPYSDSSVDTHLNQSSAGSSEVLSWNGSDYAWVANSGSYSDSSVDTHLNQSSAGSGEVLSWNGSDYAWVANAGSSSVGTSGTSDRIVSIDAGALVPRTTNGAASATEEYATNDVMSDHFLFDGATEEGVQFRFHMPSDWDGNAVNAKFYWDGATGASASDGVTWGIAMQAFQNDDALDNAFGTSVDTDDALIAVGDLHVTAESADITIAGSPSAGDLIFAEVTRVVGDANDTMTEDAKLIGVTIHYTASVSSQVSINAQTGTTYTTVLTDASKLVTLNNGSAITLTIPPNSSVAYPIGTKIDLLQIGAGQVTVAAGVGVTVNSTPTLKLRAQYSGGTCIQYAADTWIFAGDLAAS